MEVAGHVSSLEESFMFGYAQHNDLKMEAQSEPIIIYADCPTFVRSCYPWKKSMVLYNNTMANKT